MGGLTDSGAVATRRVAVLFKSGGCHKAKNRVKGTEESVSICIYFERIYSFPAWAETGLNRVACFVNNPPVLTLQPSFCCCGRGSGRLWKQ